MWGKFNLSLLLLLLLIQIINSLKSMPYGAVNWFIGSDNHHFELICFKYTISMIHSPIKSVCSVTNPTAVVFNHWRERLLVKFSSHKSLCQRDTNASHGESIPYRACVLTSPFPLYSPQNIGWPQEARVAHSTGKRNSIFLKKTES